MSSDRRPVLTRLPRMPFSSPVYEATESPSSQHSSQFQRTYSPVQKLNCGRTPANLEVLPRSKLPELNVITNFATPKDPPAKPSNTSDHVSRLVVGKGEHKRQESLQARRIRNKDGMKGPIGSLRRADSRMSALSPSDATLLIGISIPSSNFMDMKRDVTKAPAAGNLMVNRTKSDSPQTPEIIITPAKLEKQWQAPNNETVQQGHGRAVSSIYSQYPHGNWKTPAMPPMPGVPPRSLGTGIQQPLQLQKSNYRRSRNDSWGTEIDENASPEINNRSRPNSGESQLVMLKRSSGDTIATRYRSRGWWNQILSPFLDRSNTTITRHGQAIESNEPLPNHEFKYYSPPNDQILPLDLDKEISPGDRSSIWTDMSSWEAERRAMDVTRVSYTDVAKGGLGSLTSTRYIISPEFEPIAGFGAASEYYEACWHDQNSPTPFFKCHNHDCSLLQSTHSVLTTGDSVTRELSESPLVHSNAFEDVNAQKDTFRQTPSNRFSAAFAEAQTAKKRPISESTEIEEDPETTPEVQEAHVAPVVRAPSPVSTLRQPRRGASEESSERDQTEPEKTKMDSKPPPAYSPSFPDKPRRRHIAIVPPDPSQDQLDEFKSPEALTPGLRRAMSAREALPMSQVSKDNAPPPPPNIYNINQYYGDRGAPYEEPVGTSALFPPPPVKPWSKAEEKRYMKENDEERRKPESGRDFRSWKQDSSAGGKDKKRKRRRLYCLLISGLLAMIALILGLVLGLTRQHSDMPVQTSWLNITGYPPIPTGIATIAQPDAVVENTGCVDPPTMWSCALPKEQQTSIAPNKPDQPNFRVEIRFDDGATNNSATTSRKLKRSGKSSSPTANAGAIIHNSLLHIRDAFTDALYTPNPATPSQEDQVFLGNTTDGNSAPFDGEFTPFFMSFLATTPIPSKLRRRQTQNTNTTDPFPNITAIIPPPDINPDGTAAAANLLPFPSAQPLRLYNRGLPTEHYGFYNYFDRSIFLKSIAPLNETSSEVPDDESGGSSEDAASVRCTWAQTRFLVQIWTNAGTSEVLLPGNASTPVQSAQGGNATTLSADDFSRPGSFPYPVTITLDRHGGDITKKMIYCYDLDDTEYIIAGSEKLQLEYRGFGGTLVNPALGVFGNVNVTLAQGGPGGIDGGTGGCECQWKNWEGSS